MRFRRKVWILYGVFLLGFLGIEMRVIWLQGPQGERWEAMARSKRERGEALVAMRGAIRAAGGEVLAEDRRVPQLAVVPTEWRSRARARCRRCGVVHFLRIPKTPGAEPRLPRRCACWRAGTGLDLASVGSTRPRPEGWERLPPGDLAPLEAALGLPPGALHARAEARVAEIQAMVAAREARDRAAGVDDFLVNDRARAYREDLMARPLVVDGRVEREALRRVQLDETGRYRGFRITTALRRHYPQGDFAAQLVGFTSLVRDEAEFRELRATYGSRVSRDTAIGRTGLERGYQDVLCGTPGILVVARDAEGRFTQRKEHTPPTPGSSLTLSVDLGLSRFAEERLAHHGGATGYAPGGRPSGAFVLMNARTGAILAWSEMPRFHLETGREDAFDPLLAGARPDRARGLWVPPAHVPLPEDFHLTAYQDQVVKPAGLSLSRVASVAVEPGSTFKTLVGLALLHTGQPALHSFHCGSLRSPGCHDCGTVHLVTAIAKSCNQYFAWWMRNHGPFDGKAAFVGRFLQDAGIGVHPDPRMADWAAGTWLRAWVDQSPFHVVERAAAQATARLAEAGLPGAPVTVSISGAGRVPPTFAADATALEDILARSFEQIVRESACREIVVGARLEAKDGYQMRVRYDVQPMHAAPADHVAVVHGAHAFERLPRGLQQAARRVAQHGGRRFRVEGSLARRGRIWFTLLVENAIGRPGPEAPPVVQKDDGRSIGIGQGPVLMTPLQMVRVMAAVANGGRLHVPRLVRSVDGAPVAQAPGRDLGWHPEHLVAIRQGMAGVVTYGTADDAGFHRLPRDMQVHGKTGTAQVGKTWAPFDDHRPGAEDLAWHHWFAGYAERAGMDPVAFACVLHARREGGAAATSAKVVADVLEAYVHGGGR